MAGGGTGGHLYPGIAVAQALRAQAPEIQVLFLCTAKPIDRTILEPTGFEFLPQPIVPPVRTVSGLLKFWTHWRETKDLVRKVIRERQPAAVLGLGGYAAGVGVKAAAVRKVPAAMLNQDVIPGKANQYLMRYVQSICCQFEATRRYVSTAHQGKIRLTGCPIRPDIIALPPREEAIARLGLEANLNTLVVTGASQGAQTVNEAVLTALGQIKFQGWQVLHLAGKEHADAVRGGYRELAVPVRVIDFTPDMADVWAVANLAISRSGASSCAELTACGVPSLLMPYPFHRDMHQRANARVLTDGGAAILIDDEKDRRKNAVKLSAAMESLLYDADRRAAMGLAARKIGRTDAADAVAKILLQMVG